MKVKINELGSEPTDPQLGTTDDDVDDNQIYEDIQGTYSEHQDISSGLGGSDSLGVGASQNNEAISTVEPEKPQVPEEKQCWPDPLRPEAMPGLIGDFINEATKNSEADPAAILITLLSQFAISCGPNPHLMVGDTKHYARINGVVVGESSNARKGTSIGPVKAVFSSVKRSCKTSPGPLSTGEGIIYAVRDEAEDKKMSTDNSQCRDSGVDDKRLLVIEEEFSASLHATKRDGNTLSSVLRTLFDSGDCEPLTKTSKISCTSAHIGIIAHITLSELKKLLCENDKVNGFGNRFLWICARRSKLVPFPGPLPINIKQKMAEHIESAIELAHKSNEYSLTNEAKQLWADCYPDLSVSRSGTAGAIIARAAPIVLRLALTYCLFRKSNVIDTEDIESALAFWRYADQSANFIFDGNTIDDKKIHKILKCIGADEKTKTEIRCEAFSNHISKQILEDLLEELVSYKIIERETSKTGGAPKTTYRKTDAFLRNKRFNSNQTEEMVTKNAKTLKAPLTQSEIPELSDSDMQS